MLEHGVCSGQSMASTEVQNKTPLKFKSGSAVAPSHASPGHSTITSMGIEVPQKSDGIPGWHPLLDATQRLQEGRVIWAAVWCIRTNNSRNLPSCNLQPQWGDPLAHWVELQHIGAQPRVCEQFVWALPWDQWETLPGATALTLQLSWSWRYPSTTLRWQFYRGGHQNGSNHLALTAKPKHFASYA